MYSKKLFTLYESAYPGAEAITGERASLIIVQSVDRCYGAVKQSQHTPAPPCNALKSIVCCAMQQHTKVQFVGHSRVLIVQNIKEKNISVLKIRMW